jgi:molybdopterin/thiamine biosynthesis adenylyltransferase
MSLPRFLERAVDATAPLVSGLDRKAVRDRLSETSVTLRLGRDEAAARASFLLAANLLARLYPRIRLLGPDAPVEEARAEIIAINPVAELIDGDTTATLAIEELTSAAGGVSVFARGWNVFVDMVPDSDEAAAAPAALAAAAIGAAEVFRFVFADALPHPRSASQPGGFNLITLGEPVEGLSDGRDVDLGTFTLVGAGAIGQATAYALRAAGARGTMVAVDPERVELSNMQRYVLTRDADCGATKVDLLAGRLTGSGLTVVPIPTQWSVVIADEEQPTLVALDSAEARIGVQASLPGPIYNAWTQPADIGWSRHERFDEEPCLACLYWPQGQKLNEHEQIAAAFRQHPLRVLGYLVHKTPIGEPLQAGGVPPALPDLPAPPDAAAWVERPILADIASAAGVEPSELGAWSGRPLADVYQDGICGGALLHLDVGEAPRDVLVPLAHQSVLAGVMLAATFIAALVPELRAQRPAATEARFDFLAGLPQVLPRPRAKTDGCLCGDADFLTVYRGKHHNREAA